MNSLLKSLSRYAGLAAVALSLLTVPSLAAYNPSAVSSVPAKANLQALRTYYGLQTPALNLLGNVGLGDGGQGTFTWVSTSTATDDGISIINPTGNGGGGTGRWLEDILFPKIWDPTSTQTFTSWPCPTAVNGIWVEGRNATVSAPIGAGNYFCHSTGRVHVDWLNFSGFFSPFFNSSLSDPSVDVELNGDRISNPGVEGVFYTNPITRARAFNLVVSGAAARGINFGASNGATTSFNDMLLLGNSILNQTFTTGQNIGFGLFGQQGTMAFNNVNVLNGGNLEADGVYGDVIGQLQIGNRTTGLVSTSTIFDHDIKGHDRGVSLEGWGSDLAFSFAFAGGTQLETCNKVEPQEVLVIGNFAQNCNVGLQFGSNNLDEERAIGNHYVGYPTFSLVTTGTTSTSTLITGIPDTSTLKVGDTATAADLPTDPITGASLAKIQVINSSTSVTLTLAATGSNVGEAITFNRTDGGCVTGAKNGVATAGWSSGFNQCNNFTSGIAPAIIPSGTGTYKLVESIGDQVQGANQFTGWKYNGSFTAFTGDTTSGSANVINVAATGTSSISTIQVGQNVVGAGIPLGATVATVSGGGTSFTLDANHLATATASTVAMHSTFPIQGASIIGPQSDGATTFVSLADVQGAYVAGCTNLNGVNPDRPITSSNVTGLLVRDCARTVTTTNASAINLFRYGGTTNGRAINFEFKVIAVDSTDPTNYVHVHRECSGYLSGGNMTLIGSCTNIGANDANGTSFATTQVAVNTSTSDMRIQWTGIANKVINVQFTLIDLEQL